MAVLGVDRLAFSLNEEQESKKEKERLLNNVTYVLTTSKDLVRDYLSLQGPPFSSSDFIPTPSPSQRKGLPLLETQKLPSSPWKRLDLSFSAFLSLAGWFESVYRWQLALNPRATKLHKSLDLCKQQSKSLYISLAGLLGKTDLFLPPPQEVSQYFDQKVIGYVVCQSFCDWLIQSKRDMQILVAETPV